MLVRYIEQDQGETAVSASTVNSKGQVTIPAEIRNALGIAPGDRVRFYRRADGVFALERAGGVVRALRGLVAYDGPPVTIEDMNRAIAERA